jgi:hypothetical protein
VDEYGIESHPDLSDPDWQRQAEKKAWRHLRRARRRALLGRRLAWSGVLLAAVVIAGAGVYGWGKATSEDSTESTEAILPGPAVTTSASAPTVLPEIAEVDLTRPFDNTPAQNWPKDVDGLSVPTAAKVGTFSAAQVQNAYARVKQLISTAELDRRVLEQHDTSVYLALLSPSEQNRVRPILADRSTDAFSGYVTLLADGFHLLPDGTRITGTLSAHPGDPGELVVHAEYVVGYAFDPGSQGPISSPADIEAFTRRSGDYDLYTSPPFYPSDAGLALGAGSGFNYSIACTPAKAGYLAPAFSEQTPGPADPSDEARFFDPNQPMPDRGDC